MSSRSEQEDLFAANAPRMCPDPCDYFRLAGGIAPKERAVVLLFGAGADVLEAGGFNGVADAWGRHLNHRASRLAVKCRKARKHDSVAATTCDASRQAS